MTGTVESKKVKTAVRENYGRIATEQRSSGCCGTTRCCGSDAQAALIRARKPATSVA